MIYSDQLLDPRWQKIRLSVLNRDNFTCRMCGDKTTTLQIHHIKYVGKFAWETPTDYLITLCKDCHKEVERMKIDGIDPIFFIKI